MTASYPLVPLWQSHGAGVAIFSLNGMVDIGINMDRTLIARPEVLTQAIRDAFEELKATPARAPEPPKKVKKAPPMGTR